jgi:glycosyltransferase involved in cell wall biosynthesis
MRVVVAELLTQTASRSARQLLAQQWCIQLARRFVPAGLTLKMAWDTYQAADAFIALNSHEAALMTQLFGADPKKTHVIYNGVERAFLDAPEQPRGQWLVCTATITERKRVVELSRAAILAKTPVWILGKPYHANDPYMAAFQQCVGSAPDLVRFEGPVSDRARLAQIYRQARGFVLLSDCESLSLSALEAAACGCPLLLSDLPWARSVFKEQVRYAPAFQAPSQIAPHLRRFFDDAPSLQAPFRPATWTEIAQQILALYESLLREPIKTSR